MLPGKTLVGVKKIDGLVYVAVVDVESIRKHLAPVIKEEHTRYLGDNLSNSRGGGVEKHVSYSRGTGS